MEGEGGQVGAAAGDDPGGLARQGGLEELGHLLAVARDDHHEFIAVVFHQLDEGVDRFLAVVLPRPDLVSVLASSMNNIPPSARLTASVVLIAVWPT